MVKSVVMTLIGLAFVALGVFLLVRGDPENVALAWGAIAFFGACAAVGLVELFPITRRAKLNREGALIVRQVAPIAMPFAGIAMGAGCFFLAPYAAAQGDVFMSYIAYFGAVFFGGGSFLALVWTLIQPPLARIDASGIEMFGGFGWKLAWREIVATNAQSLGRDQGWFEFVTIHEAANEHDARDLDEDDDWDERKQEPSNRRMLSLAGTRLAFEDVSKIVDELWRRHRGD